MRKFVMKFSFYIVYLEKEFRRYFTISKNLPLAKIDLTKKKRNLNYL